MSLIFWIFSVVTRRLAELVGGDEQLFEAWNRIELGSVSINLECPRYVLLLLSPTYYIGANSSLLGFRPIDASKAHEWMQRISEN